MVRTTTTRCSTACTKASGSLRAKPARQSTGAEGSRCRPGSGEQWRCWLLTQTSRPPRARPPGTDRWPSRRKEILVGGVALGLGLLGMLAAVTPVYLVILASASFAKAGPAARPIRLPRLVVLVPAHDESDFIARCVRSIRNQSYPADRYKVVVIADNCTDSTAALASAAGADVMVRTDTKQRGKGQALRWALDRLLAAPDAPEAVVVVDADSIADKELLVQLAASYAAGNESVQADDLLRSDVPSLRAELEAIALLLRNQVRFAGRAALGMPAALCGNG